MEGPDLDQSGRFTAQQAARIVALAKAEQARRNKPPSEARRRAMERQRAAGNHVLSWEDDG